MYNIPDCKALDVTFYTFFWGGGGEKGEMF